MRAAARRALAAGITTVRDLGDRHYLAVRLRDELTVDPTAGPQILAAGPPITTPGGHCWFLGGEASGVEGVRAAVRAHAARGVDVIKVMASGGELTPGSRPDLPQYGLDELAAIVDEARRLGLPTAAHAHSGHAISRAVAVGFDSVEHCSFATEDGVEPLPGVIAALGRSRTVVSATLSVLPGAPPPSPGVPALLPKLAALMRQITAAGATIVWSSDAGVGPGKPHDVLPYGAAMAVELLHWSPLDALRAVTSAPANLCRLGDRKGRLAAGSDADILAVDGDPLTDIAALRAVSAVFRLGRRVPPPL
jgi:imidazolonepropionase-like amidohydrolase